MLNKIAETGLWRSIGGRFDNNSMSWVVSNVALLGGTIFTADVFESIGGGNLLIAFDIESISNCFGNGQSEVESTASGNSAESVDDSPRLVQRLLTVGAAGAGLQGTFEADGANEGDQCGGKLTEALICEDSCHHGATPFNSREFGSDNCRQWVIATDARSEHKAPKD